MAVVVLRRDWAGASPCLPVLMARPRHLLIVSGRGAGVKSRDSQRTETKRTHTDRFFLSVAVKICYSRRLIVEGASKHFVVVEEKRFGRRTAAIGHTPDLPGYLYNGQTPPCYP